MCDCTADGPRTYFLHLIPPTTFSVFLLGHMPPLHMYACMLDCRPPAIFWDTTGGGGQEG